MPDAHTPWRAARLRADGAYVAAEIDEPVRDAVIDENGRRPVGRVFLADTAEIDLHAGAWQTDRALVPLDIGPANLRERGRESGLLGERGRLPTEIPRSPQNSRSEIEQSAALSETAIRIGKEPGRFGVDGHRRAAGGAIDARGQAVVQVTRILGLDAPHVGDGGVRCPARARRVGVDLNLVVRRHRAEGKAQQGHR